MDEAFKFDQYDIIESENYRVHVGTVPGDKVAQYLVFHRKYNVLEFAHNMIYHVNQAVMELEEKLLEQEKESKDEELPPIEGRGNASIN